MLSRARSTDDALARPAKLLVVLREQHADAEAVVRRLVSGGEAAHRAAPVRGRWARGRAAAAVRRRWGTIRPYPTRSAVTPGCRIASATPPRVRSPPRPAAPGRAPDRCRCRR